jgi:hypothetical protein
MISRAFGLLSHFLAHGTVGAIASRAIEILVIQVKWHRRELK